MPTWATVVTVTLGLLTCGLLGYAGLLARRCVLFEAQLRQQAGFERDLTNFNRLLHLLTGTDWQRHPAVLVQAILSGTYAEGAALLAVGDQGQLEIRATASADGSDWDPRHEPMLQAAAAAKERLAAPESASLFLPLLDKSDLIGVLAMTGVAPGGAVSPFLEGCTLLAHLSLTNQRTLSRQLSLSTTDGLTGLMNHRHFQQMLSVILAQSYLEHTVLSLVMLDIDHFKRLNDTYGHLVGDLVLREVAGVLRRNVPQDTLVARYGGEEFAVVLPGYSVEDATRIAERLRTAVAAHKVLDPNSGSPVGVTISAGIAAHSLGMGKSHLISRADEALYLSKQTGRNRVTIMPAEPVDRTAFAHP